MKIVSGAVLPRWMRSWVSSSSSARSSSRPSVTASSLPFRKRLYVPRVVSDDRESALYRRPGAWAPARRQEGSDPIQDLRRARTHGQTDAVGLERDLVRAAIRSRISHTTHHRAIRETARESGTLALAKVSGMASAVLGARILLAVVFATAGVAKLLDRRGTREALEGFGVPGSPYLWSDPAPVAELATAVALGPRPLRNGAGLPPWCCCWGSSPGSPMRCSGARLRTVTASGSCTRNLPGAGRWLATSCLRRWPRSSRSRARARRSPPGSGTAAPPSWSRSRRASRQSSSAPSRCGSGKAIGI